MYEADLWSCFRNSLKPKADERAEVAADGGERDTAGLEVGGVNWSFKTASCNSDNTAQRRSMLEQGKKIGDEADAGIDSQRGQQVKMLRGFCSTQLP